MADRSAVQKAGDLAARMDGSWAGSKAVATAGSWARTLVVRLVVQMGLWMAEYSAAQRVEPLGDLMAACLAVETGVQMAAPLAAPLAASMVDK